MRVKDLDKLKGNEREVVERRLRINEGCFWCCKVNSIFAEKKLKDGGYSARAFWKRLILCKEG